MSFLDKPVSDMSLAELQRLIRQEVGRQVPAIPTGVLGLGNLDVPLVPPDTASNNQVLTYAAASGKYIASTITSGTPVSDAGTPGTPVVTLIAGPGWIQAKWAKPSGTSDIMQYKVFIRAGAAPTTADATYLVGTTSALSLVMNTLADGTTQLRNDTVYHVIVVAVSILSGGGTSAASADVTASPAAIDGVITTFTNIQAGTITAGSIDSARMSANVVTAIQATITQLSAIRADLGSITAGTVTGGTIRSASADPAVYMDTTGIYAHDAFGTQTFKIDANTGTFKGSVFLDSAAGLTLTGGVSQPLTAPTLTATAGGSLTASTTYFVTYAWYDGTHETPFYVTVPSRATTLTNKTIQLVIPAAPTGATYARVYMDTSTFVQGGGKLQTLSNADTKVAVSTSATTTISVTALAAGAASPTSQAIAQQGVFGTTATIQPANATDSTGAHYGWTLEGNGRARFLGPTLNTQFWLYDDFYYPAAQYPATTVQGTASQWLIPASTGTASQVTAGTSTNADPGLVQCVTGTTTTGRAFLRTNNSFALGVGRFRFSVYFMWDTAPNGTNSFIAAMGLTSTNGTKALAATDNGIVIQNDTDSTAKVMLASADGATLSTVVSSVTVAGGTWVFCEFEVDAGRTAINWWINNVKQTAITSHLPTSGTTMFLQMGILKTATGSGTISRTLNVDSVSLFGDYVTG